MKIMAEGVSSLSLISCPICFEVYHSNKTPKVLHCGHTFCSQCLGKMVLNYRCAYIQCPTCRKEIHLPQSGKAEDFQTNFALMNLVSDLQAQSQNRTKTVQAPSGLMQEDTAGLECPQHKIPMKFYCETCQIQVCAECLLNHIEVGQHCIVSVAAVAVNLSHQLQRLTEKLQYYEQEKHALGNKINAAIQNCQHDQEKLQEVIQRNLHREIQKLQEAAAKMFDQIGEKANTHARAHEKLKHKYSHIHILHKQIKGKCSTLNQDLQQQNLSQFGQLEKLDQDIDNLKNQIDSLKATCQSTPTNVGLAINPAQGELGITLSQVSNKAKILQVHDLQNGNNSSHGNNAETRPWGVLQYVTLPYSGHFDD